RVPRGRLGSGPGRTHASGLVRRAHRLVHPLALVGHRSGAHLRHPRLLGPAAGRPSRRMGQVSRGPASARGGGAGTGLALITVGSLGEGDLYAGSVRSHRMSTTESVPRTDPRAPAQTMKGPLMDLLFGVGGIGVLIVIILIALIVILRSYKIAAPSEALIITGRNASGAPGSGRIVIAGRAVVYPIVQKAFMRSLSSRQIQVESDGISINGIALRLKGVAQVKVGGTEDDVRKAAQRFLDQQEQIDHYSKEILSGTLRAVVGTLTVEQIIQDRASFAAQVQEESAHSMNNQGLIIDTFQISAVEDEGSYLRDWGRPQAAEVAKNAAIAEANAGRASAVEEAQQNEETQKQQALTDQAIAEQQQQLALRRAALKEEADQRQATADNAGPLATAAEKQKLLEKDRVVAKEAAELRAEQLDAEVRRPADAERYR